MVLDDVEDRFGYFSTALGLCFNNLFHCSSNLLVTSCLFSFQVAQFLVGLAERQSPNAQPTRYKCAWDFL